MKGDRKYLKLKYKLKEMDLVPYKYVAEQLGMSEGQLSSRLCGKVDWFSGEMYKVLRLIKEPVEKMTEYFPEDGVLQQKQVKNL